MLQLRQLPWYLLACPQGWRWGSLPCCAQLLPLHGVHGPTVYMTFLLSPHLAAVTVTWTTISTGMTSHTGEHGMPGAGGTEHASAKAESRVSLDICPPMSRRNLMALPASRSMSATASLGWEPQGWGTRAMGSVWAGQCPGWGSFTTEGPQEVLPWLAGAAAAPLRLHSHHCALVPLQGVRVPEDPPPH